MEIDAEFEGLEHDIDMLLVLVKQQRAELDRLRLERNQLDAALRQATNQGSTPALSREIDRLRHELANLMDAGILMRNAQNNYFKTRTHGALIIAKQAEKRFDELLK